jgi:hypothetical protein
MALEKRTRANIRESRHAHAAQLIWQRLLAEELRGYRPAHAASDGRAPGGSVRGVSAGGRAGDVVNNPRDAKVTI